MGNYPGALPSAGTANPADTLAAAGHTSLHNTAADENRSIATKIGTGSSTPTSAKLLRGNGVGTSAWAQADLTTDVTGVLPQANGGTGTTLATGTGKNVYDTSPTIATPAITNPTVSGGGSWSGSPSLSTPTISDFSNSTHNHTNNAGGGVLNGTTALSAASTNDSRLVYGKLRTRTGGSATNWGTAGTSNFDYSATNVFTQSGTSSGSSGADVTITFGTAYSQVPNVVAVVSTANNANCYVVISGRSATSFTFRCIDAAGTQRSEEITWWAVGE